MTDAAGRLGAPASDGLIYSLVLELAPRREATLGPTQGYHAHALVLQVLQERDPELARELHDQPGPKPFTVSPLRGRFGRRGSNLWLSPAEVYWLRLTLLRDDVLARLLDALIHLPAELDLRLESAAFGLRRIVTTPGQSEWAGFSSTEMLLAQARPERRLRLAFCSPTAFRSAGQRNVPLPLPGLVFGSLLAKWNEFAPTRLPEGLRAVADEGLLVARYRLETRMLDFGRYREVGFEGICEYECAEGVSAEAAAQLGALADFAFYAGVGAKTAMGMGQARRVAGGPRRAPASGGSRD